MAKRGIVATAVLSIAALGASAITHPMPRLVWNATTSAPVGFYRVEPPAKIQRGDFVLAWLPGAARQLAAARDYLPANVPLVKRVAALTGDTVCSEHAQVTINGVVAATELSVDSNGRSLPHWYGCLPLRQDEVFLLMAGSPDSFDGRYFGPVATRAIVGKLLPLWTR